MKPDEELTVITKTYDLILWSCNHTGRFPHNHRFVLGERIERNLYELLETLIQAKYTRQRQPLREEANLTLEILRFQMRLAKDLQCLKPQSYAFAANAVDEIGRLIGGWLRSRGEFSVYGWSFLDCPPSLGSIGLHLAMGKKRNRETGRIGPLP